jgi:hypothetical protein
VPRHVRARTPMRSSRVLGEEGLATMRGTASARWKERAPKRLMERLEALAMAQTAEGASLRERTVENQQRVLRVFFGLGFAASGVIGCLMLLVLVLNMPAIRGRAEDFAKPQFVTSVTAPNPAFSSAILDLPVWRGARANVPFSLRIAGVGLQEAAQSGLSVRLLHVPETAWLSKGERQDEHTWALRASDLEGLRLTLSDGTPDVFDVAIEVLSAAGAMATQGVARVRVLDEPASVAVAMPDNGLRHATRIAPQAVGVPLRVAPARTEIGPAQKTASRAVAARPVGAEAPAPPQASAAVRPEGLSALGGPVRANDNRQIWWQIPLPAWAPFTTAPGGK